MAAKKASKASAPKKAPAKKAPKRAATTAATKKAATKKAAAPASPRAPVRKTRVVMPTSFYEEHKDDIKAPIKEHDLKWNFLGQGKGLYKRADGGVHCFTQFKDDGVHYSVWGEDQTAVKALLGAWRALLGEEAWKTATASGEEAVAEEKAEAESEALKLWRIGEPQRRPGEPDFFFEKRLAEWRANKPA